MWLFRDMLHSIRSTNVLQMHYFHYWRNVFADGSFGFADRIKSADRSLETWSKPWSSEGFIPGGQQWIFLRVVKRIFSGGPKVVKFHFINSKLREQLFVLKIYQGNIKFQNPTAASFPSAPPPFPTTTVEATGCETVFQICIKFLRF